MPVTHPPVPVMERILAEFGRHGYGTEMVAVSLASTERLDSALAVLRFGDRVDDVASGAVAGVDVRIDMSGDICNGRLRRWRITKTFPVRHASMQAIDLDAVVTLRGDISADFVRRQGKVGLMMMRSSIDDAEGTLGDLRPTACARDARGPIVHIEVKMVGDIAIARSGLVRTGDGGQAVTLEARAVRSMICDRLARWILPEIAIVTAAALAKAQVVKNTLSDPLARVPSPGLAM